MKTRRFDFNYKPLQIDICTAVDGSVPGKQDYNADTDTYTPDYTLTPLIIQPRISMLDKDEILQAGAVNHLLANVTWREIVNGVSTLIDSGNTSYEVTTAGSNAGRIKVKKNSRPQQPITLQFFAEYTDTRTGQVYTIQDTYLVRCQSSTEHLSLTLDCAAQTIYNPLNDPAAQTVTACLRVGVNVCDPANVYYIWEVQNDDNVWEDVRTCDMAYFISQPVAGAAFIVIDRSLMGSMAQIRCRALYDAEGNPSSKDPTPDMPTVIASFVRRLPKYEYDICETPINIPAGVLEIAPTANIWDTNGTITNPERELQPIWYMATNKASGSLSYVQVAEGMTPAMPTGLMSKTLGGVMGLDVKDRGPVAVWEDSDGKLFEDADGKLILIH